MVGEGGIDEQPPLDDSIGALLMDEEDDDNDNESNSEEEPSIVNVIVDMASNCEVLSIRGFVDMFLTLSEFLRQ